MTEQEKEEIIAATAERVMLALPEVIGNLMVNKVMETRINREFYQKHPKLVAHSDTVRSVIEETQGKNPIDDYDTLLEKSIPEIKKRIEVMKGLNMTDVPKPNRDLGKLNLQSDHGEL